MKFDLVNDLGAPAAVTAIDLVTEATVPEWNEWAAYLVAGGSYIGAFMGWGGDFVKNMGIAAFPWAAKKIYDRVRGGVTSRPSHLTLRRVARPVANISRYPAPAYSDEFAGVRLD